MNLNELKELAIEMLQKYQRTEEQHYVTSFVQVALRDFETWQFEREKEMLPTKKSSAAPGATRDGAAAPYDDWDNL